MRELMGIYGIGPAKAKTLMDAGILSVTKLKKRMHEPKLLTKAQRLGVEWYDDLRSRIPRKEIDSMKRWLEQNAPKSLRWCIVGSYRRGANTSGDVDVLVTGNGRKDLITKLTNVGILRHTLVSGSKKYMGLGILPGGTKIRHIDIIETTQQEYPFTMLYFTGSADWNVKMRHQANKHTLRLNEHSYTHIKSGKELTTDDYQELIGKDVPETEEDVCRVIEWEYKEPEHRV